MKSNQFGLIILLLGCFPLTDTSENNKDNERQCTICLIYIHQEESKTYKSPCDHYFHTECINVWIGPEYKKNLCPNCRGILNLDITGSDQHRNDDFIEMYRRNFHGNINQAFEQYREFRRLYEAHRSLQTRIRFILIDRVNYLLPNVPNFCVRLPISVFDEQGRQLHLLQLLEEGFITQEQIQLAWGRSEYQMAPHFLQDFAQRNRPIAAHNFENDENASIQISHNVHSLYNADANVEENDSDEENAEDL